VCIKPEVPEKSGEIRKPLTRGLFGREKPSRRPGPYQARDNSESGFRTL